MDQDTYKIIHYVGIFILIFSLGSMFTKYNKGAAIGHGVGLLLALVAGFGMMAKTVDGFPLWIILKIAIWFAFGAALVLAKKQKIKGLGAYVLVVGLAGAAAALALFKPFV